jgi:hypothetical protein
MRLLLMQFLVLSKLHGLLMAPLRKLQLQLELQLRRRMWAAVPKMLLELQVLQQRVQL